jgi:peptidoglycan/xylan/chitin deacetylase (PgdA/CDA1 family)
LKIIMYHYIRLGQPDLPYFRYLHLENFKLQLDHFAKVDRLLDFDEFINIIKTGKVPDDGIVLTFDDGLRDHFDFVLPELQSRKLWGIFYIPTGVYATKKLLGVHRIHYLVGRLGGERLLEMIEGLVSDDMLTRKDIKGFRTNTYTRHPELDSATNRVKRILNYYISYRWRESILDQLMENTCNEEKIYERYYINPKEIAEMQQREMIVGSHGISHRVFASMNQLEQKTEIEEAYSFLNQVTGGLKLKTFSYPYGRHHTFTRETENILKDNGTLFSFAVDCREINEEDVICRPQALPRFDCNQFPHGEAHIGMQKFDEALTGSSGLGCQRQENNT